MRNAIKKLNRQLEKVVGSFGNFVQAYVKPGGALIYSTCTIHQGENEENVEWFLEHFPFEAVSLEDCLPKGLNEGTASKGYIQLLPGIHAGDGFFIAKFRRKS
ncbi:MAG: hypothetical protein HFI28_09915 [Lachnospiraceae bacterium]|nr:hypothetical protein [Lachnospiraceae bacterium]